MGICENQNKNELKYSKGKNANQEKIDDDKIFIDKSQSLSLALIKESTKSICQIIKHSKEGIMFGAGFFTNFGESKKYVITNYHIIYDSMVNDKIELKIYNGKKISIKLKEHDIKFCPKLDITLLEINNIGKIFTDIRYLHCDLNYKKIYKIYKEIFIFRIGYPQREEISFNYGEIININHFKFDHNIQNEMGQSGCPIMILNNNINIIEVIGIHTETKIYAGCGTFIGAIFEKEIEAIIYKGINNSIS